MGRRSGRGGVGFEWREEAMVDEGSRCEEGSRVRESKVGWGILSCTNLGGVSDFRKRGERENIRTWGREYHHEEKINK